MKYLISVTTSFFLIFLCNTSFAQGLFEEGQSGFGVNVQLASNNGETTIGISPNYTSNGQFTGGVSIGTSSTVVNGTRLSATSVRPYLSFLALRQNEEMPINVGGGVAYQYDTFNQIDGLSASTIAFLGGISHIIQATDKIRIIPSLTASYRLTTVLVQGNKVKSSGLSYILGGTLAFKKFHISPSIAFANGNSAFTLLAGIYFPQ